VDGAAKNMRETIKTYGSGLLFAVFVGFSFLGLKTMVQYANALEAITYRYNFAFVALLICLLFRIIKVDFKEKPVFKKAIPAASFYILFMLLQAAGLMFATSIESGIIFAIIPIFAAFLSVIITKERPSLLQTVFMMLSITSLIIMILFGATSLHFSLIGTTLLILSSLSLALNNVLMRYVRSEFKAMEITTVIIIEGFIVLNVICLIWEFTKGNIGNYLALISNPTFVIAGIYLGVPCLLVSAALMAYMVSRIVALKATIFGNLSTAISIVAGVLVLGEPLYWYHIVCTALIITGVIGVSSAGSKHQ